MAVVSESSRSLKRIKNEGRLSNLPYPLILQILSSLPSTIHAAKTSILSKQWQCLWTALPTLDFPNPDDIHPNLFVPFVNRCLILNDSPNIFRFRVEMDYTKSFASDVDVWLRFATRKNVVELDLSLQNFAAAEYYSDDEDEDHDDQRRYCWPSNVFSCNSSLVVLRLKNIEIDFCGRLIQLKSLKFLSLANMDVTNEFFRGIISGSPLLERLEMATCYGYDFLRLESERLRKLVIYEHEICGGVTPLKISAPSLQSLEMSGVLNTYKLSLVNMSSLVDAKIVFSLGSLSHGIDEIRVSKYPKIMEKLLGSLWHVKDLAVGSWCLQMLSLLEEKTILCPLSRLVCLTINTDLSERELPGIAKLLAMMPLLETLVIEVFSRTPLLTHLLKVDDPVQENYWSSQKSYFASALENLKVVRIVGFLSLQSEIELVMFLLENASTLEKMIIQAHTTSVVGLPRSLKIAQKLLSCPRCSQHAIILFT